MARQTKFRFPIPHRRPKQTVHEVQSISAPLTNKAQKLLGTGEINIDSSPMLSNESRIWETRSAASGATGISVTVSEVTTSAGTRIGARRSPLGISGGDRPAAGGNNGGRAHAWDQDSDVLPKALGGSTMRGQTADSTTDASSLRRRRSSSTIVSYYDKTKLPLSISQQTSSSAMAKGLPAKAAELLSMDSPAASPPKPEKRRKPAKLDLTHLLPVSGSTPRNAINKLTHKGSMVLGPDLMTKSPSVVSLSFTDAQPSPIQKNKLEKTIRKKLTRESLRSSRSEQPPPRPQRLSVMSSDTINSISRKHATDTGTLYHLYEHYEHLSFRDSMMNSEVPVPRSASRLSVTTQDSELRAPSRQSILSQQYQLPQQSPAFSVTSPTKPRHYATPSLTAVSRRPSVGCPPSGIPGTIAEVPLQAELAPSALASPPTDYAASVSSRHTRTSKASKRTDQSFTDFDPLMNSVLSLSSDSEDDDPEPPTTAISVPSSDGKGSASSLAEAKRRNGSLPGHEHPYLNPIKSRFRASVTAQGQYLSIPEKLRGATPPLINPRSSSLMMGMPAVKPGTAVSTSTNGSASTRSQSRLSMMSTSTGDSIPSQRSFSRPLGNQLGRVNEIRHIAMVPTRTAPPEYDQEDAPVEQQDSKKAKHLSPPLNSQPTPPLSPSSMESFIRNQHNSQVDCASPTLTLNGTGSVEDERFMAVTKQEEMLLAAMRMKRALMRESLSPEPLNPHRHQIEDDRTASKKESLSSIKTVKNTLHPPPLNLKAPDVLARTVFPKPPSTKASSIRSGRTSSTMDSGRQEQVLMFLDRTVSTVNAYDMAEPSPDLSDFMEFDSDDFPLPPGATSMSGPGSPTTTSTTMTQSSHSRPSSGAYLNSLRAAQSKRATTSRPRPDSDFMGSARASGEFLAYRSVDPGVKTGGHPERQRERGTERNQDPGAGVPRPDSPIEAGTGQNFRDSLPRKKAVRISAVGLPEAGVWGDDG